MLCCLRISSSDQWNQGEKKGEHGLENSDVGMDIRTQDDCCFFSVYLLFIFGRNSPLPDSLEEGGEQVFVLTLRHIRRLKQSCSALSTNLLGVGRQADRVKANTSHHSLVDTQPL